MGQHDVTPEGFLEVLPSSSAASLLAAGRRRPMRRQQVLFYEGDDPIDAFIIRTGIVKISIMARSGRAVILDVFGAGELLGDLSAFDGSPRSATATALTEGEVLAIPSAAFRSAVEQQPGVACAVLALVAGRLRIASQRQLEFGATDSLGRVCGCLLSMADRYGSVGARGRVLEVPMGQADLASWVGLSREAVVKGLRSLRLLGWVEAEGRNVVLVDEASMRDRASS